MNCDDFDGNPCRAPRPGAVPPPHVVADAIRREAAVRRCEDEVLALLVARPTPTDAEIVASVLRARALLRAAAHTY